MGPDQRIQAEAIEGKRQARHRGGQPACGPAMGQEVHPQSRQDEMGETKNAQGPRKRREQVKKRDRV